MVDGPLKVCVHRIQRSARTLGRRCRSIDVAADIRYLSVCRRLVSVMDFAFFFWPQGCSLLINDKEFKRNGSVISK